MFIEVTREGEPKTNLVNVDRILRITYFENPANGVRHTRVILEGGIDTFTVKESYEDIKEKLAWCGRLNPIR